MPLLAEGEFALVRYHLEEALKHSMMLTTVPNGDHDMYAELVEVAVQQRDQAALRQYAPLAEETAMRMGHAFYTAIAHRAWGVAHTLGGEYDNAGTRLNQALELFRGLGMRWQIGRTFFELGELARAEAKSTDARAHFSAALVAFEELHAAPDAARARAALENLPQV